MAYSAARQAVQKGGTLGSLGAGMGIASAVTGAVGAYYAVKANEYRAKSEAANLEHQQDLSYIEARQAERAAQRSILAGHREAARAGLRYGQAKASASARQSAAGVQAGVGSSAEINASIELAKQIDQQTITRNAVLEASAHRAGQINAQARGAAAGASAAGLRGSAATMRPGLAGAASLIGSSSKVAMNWYAMNKVR